MPSLGFGIVAAGINGRFLPHNAYCSNKWHATHGNNTMQGNTNRTILYQKSGVIK